MKGLNFELESWRSVAIGEWHYKERGEGGENELK